MMTREMLDRNIKTLNDELLILESMVKEATLGAVASLIQRDYETSRQIYADDRRINRRRFDIDRTRSPNTGLHPGSVIGIGTYGRLCQRDR